MIFIFDCLLYQVCRHTERCKTGAFHGDFVILRVGFKTYVIAACIDRGHSRRA